MSRSETAGCSKNSVNRFSTQGKDFRCQILDLKPHHREPLVRLNEVCLHLLVDLKLAHVEAQFLFKRSFAQREQNKEQMRRH